jgi:hypothetical protein
MTDSVNVIFNGDITPNTSPEEVLAALARLFKTEPSKLRHWLSGQTITIKRDITLEQAQKYINAMAKAGALAVIATTHSEASAPPSESAQSPHWSIAAPGSDVLRPDEVFTPDPVSVDISHFRTLDNSELVIHQDEPSAVAIPDTSGLNLKPVGLLVEDNEVPQPTQATPDISALDILPPGEIENLADKRPPASPDISHLSLEN